MTSVFEMLNMIFIFLVEIMLKNLNIMEEYVHGLGNNLGLKTCFEPLIFCILIDVLLVSCFFM